MESRIVHCVVNAIRHECRYYAIIPLHRRLRHTEYHADTNASNVHIIAAVIHATAARMPPQQSHSRLIVVITASSRQIITAGATRGERHGASSMAGRAIGDGVRHHGLI